MSTALFFLAATGAIAGAVGVVLVGDTFYSVLALVGHLASLLLLIAAVGAVVLARRRDGLEGEEPFALGGLGLVRAPGTGTMAEAVGGALAAEHRGEPASGLLAGASHAAVEEPR